MSHRAALWQGRGIPCFVGHPRGCLGLRPRSATVRRTFARAGSRPVSLVWPAPRCPASLPGLKGNRIVPLAQAERNIFRRTADERQVPCGFLHAFRAVHRSYAYRLPSKAPSRPCPSLPLAVPLKGAGRSTPSGPRGMPRCLPRTLLRRRACRVSSSEPAGWPEGLPAGWHVRCPARSPRRLPGRCPGSEPAGLPEGSTKTGHAGRTHARNRAHCLSRCPVVPYCLPCPSPCPVDCPAVPFLPLPVS